MKKYPYIIMAPEYRHNSAGVRALYELARRLEGKGYKADIYQGGKATDKHIVVYPETVPGNPMCAETVVRYVLNYPGKLGGDKVYDSKEIIFTHSKLFIDAPLLTVPLIEDFFKDEGLKREGGCFWIGKGKDVPRIPGIDGLTEITNEWPATRKELARLLNTKEVFYTYDNNTQLISEAEMCGCKVVVVGEKLDSDYKESVKDFDNQLDEFIRITQEAASKKIKVSFGCLVNDAYRFNTVLKKSDLPGNVHVFVNPESATKGLNQLLDKMDVEGADIAILTHQDMYYRNGWLQKAKEQLSLLPESWIVAGIIGKDMEGRICGKLHDMRIVDIINTSAVHTFPQEAACFDECCLIINLKTGFRFDESLDGFDLYGTLAVLQAWEMGGTAWVIDAFAEHYCMRPFTWFPDDVFKERYKKLYDRYSNKFGQPDSTVFVNKPRFETSAE